MLEMVPPETPVRHIFAPGIYIRELRMKKGMMAIGHSHKVDHLNVMLSGRVIILNDDGTTKELVAPCTFMGKPGRKVGIIIEDVVWQNIYATNETDIETLEDTYIEKSDAFLASEEERKTLLLGMNNPDRDDFSLMLEETGYTKEQEREESENLNDQIPMPFGWSKASVYSSDIQGKGYFATANIEPEEVIAPAMIGFKRTPAGRYTNHAKYPNAKMVIAGDGCVNLVAMNFIHGCKGGEMGQEITIDYRQKMSMEEGVCLF